MAEALTPKKHERYNASGSRIADALVAARVAMHKGAQQDGGVERSRERLFPPFNRAGLGVALEYERMGKGPVTADLQQRAKQFGVEFEHIGVTMPLQLAAGLGRVLGQPGRATLRDQRLLPS